MKKSKPKKINTVWSKLPKLSKKKQKGSTNYGNAVAKAALSGLNKPKK